MAHSKRNEYLLMNKDIPVMEFHCTRNEYDEPEFTEHIWYMPYKPIGYRNIVSFLDSRKAPKHRCHIQRLLEQYGCDDLEGFINVAHALSLNDTFWVRRADSSLAWRDVSLYANEFNELISMAAFDGSLSNISLSSTSPEFSTDGYYAKCWSREPDGIYLYKTGSKLYELEPFSEFLASQLAKAICPHSCFYDLAEYRDKLVSKCKLFTSEKHGLVKAAAIFGNERTLPELLEYFESIKSGDKFRRMCVLDALTFNPDRHYGNFGATFDNDTMEIIEMCLVFDNNRSFFPELDQGQLENPDWYIERCKPRLGKSFVLNAKNLATEGIRSDLRNLKGFSFEQHPNFPLRQERVDALSRMVDRQIDAILTA